VAFRARDLIFLVLGTLLTGAGIAPSAAQNAARPAAPFPVATDTRVGGDDNLTRFVVDFSRKIDLRAFTLADPYRVVIDLPQVTFNLPPKTGETGRGLVKAFRFGLVMQGGSRIVLDVNKPVKVEKAFALEAQGGQPARLVLDLVATDRDSFMRNLAAENRTPPPGATAGITQATAEARRGDTRPIVVIDPGHGGIDNGTIASTGVMEKQIVLDFAMALRERLEQSGRYRVVMTRTDDSFIPLADRVRMARIRQAALFISIHADALKKGEGEAQGATVYTLSETASDAEAGRLAEREPRRRDRRHRPVARTQRGGRHPDRSRPARDQDVLDPVRQVAGGEHAQGRQDAQESAEVGGLQGAEGTGCAVGADRARLCFERSRPQAAHLRDLAGQDRRLDRPGCRHLFGHPDGGLGGRCRRQQRRAMTPKPQFQHKNRQLFRTLKRVVRGLPSTGRRGGALRRDRTKSYNAIALRSARGWTGQIGIPQ
jgi:N-acetylmuramoyl-L-alanine amidase